MNTATMILLLGVAAANGTARPVDSPLSLPSPPLRGGEGDGGKAATSSATSTALIAALPSPPQRGGEGQGEGQAATGSTDAELTLSDALAELDQQNLTVAQARARADEARALARQAAAPLLPALWAQGSYARNSDEAVVQRPPSAEPLFIQPLEQFTVSGALRVPIVSPSGWFDRAAASRAARAADLSVDAVRLQVRAAFTQSAHAAAASDEIVVASERAVESAAELVRSAERRVAAGTAAPLDTLRARTEAVRRESDLARARAERERARLALGILLGRDAPVRVVVASDAQPAPADADPVAVALSRRPELAAQHAQVEAAEAQVRSAWARLAPQLSGTGSAFASDVPYPTGEKEGWRATIDLTWSLYDGGFRYGKRREAEARLASARAGTEAQRLQVVQEVRDATRDVAVAGERLRLAETQRRLAADAAASARRSFEAGIASSLDVVDANDRQYVADVGLAEARARLAQARVALDRALGRGPEENVR